MLQAYCTTCAAEVTVRHGRCLLDHRVASPPRPSRGGRHRAVKSRAKVAAATFRPTPPAAADLPTHADLPVDPLPPRAPLGALLDLLGFTEDGDEPKVPTPGKVRTLPRPPRPQPRIDGHGSWARLPRLADMDDGDATVTTDVLVERLWAATAEQAATRDAEEWKPEEFSPVAGSPRRHRRSALFLILALLALAAATVVAAIQLPSRVETQLRSDYRLALADLEQQLPGLRQDLAVVTDPSIEPVALSESTVALSQLDDAARELFDLASTPLPALPGFLRGDLVEVMTPVSDSSLAIAERGLALERRLADTLTYRLVFARAFQLPELPDTATAEEITAVSVDLSMALAATNDLLSQLPEDPSLDAHRLQAERVAERWEAWQVEYVTALRGRKTVTAGALVRELTASVANLDTALQGPLAEIAQWAGAELTLLGDELRTLHGQLD